MRLRPNSFWSKAVVSLGLLWFVAVILAYYAVNKPLNSPQFNSIIDLWLVALGWLSAISLANLIGWTVIRKISRLEHGERFVLQVGVGLGMIALAMLVLGLVGAYSQTILWLLVLLLLPVSLYRLYRDTQDFHLPSKCGLGIFVGLALALLLGSLLALL
jgi:hypothetical protein